MNELLEKMLEDMEKEFKKSSFLSYEAQIARDLVFDLRDEVARLEEELADMKNRMSFGGAELDLKKAKQILYGEPDDQ